MTLPPAAAVSAAALLTLLPLLTPAALAAPQQDEPPMVEGVEYLSTVEGISEYRLPNGLKILLFPDASRPTVTVNCTVFVGSRHEGYGETGMAHLLEHMVFKGTPTFENVPKELQDRGAVFNGSTWLDRTNYYETLPATDGNLEFAIHLEADRLVNSYVKQEDLDSEMTVVRNEFERGENSPSRVLMQRMLAVAFEWHNYGKSTIGNRADIERVPIENLRAFYERFYQPDNAMLIVAGSFDPVKALRYAKEHFGSIPKPDRTLPSTYTEEPPQDGERTVILRRVGDVARTGAVYHVPAGSDPAFAAVDVLESILTDNPSGRLYKQLVETKRAASVSGGTFALHDPGVILVQAEVAEGNDPRDVLQTLLDTVEGVPDEPVTKIEVDRAKRRLLAARERSANNTTRIAVNLSEWAAQGDWRLYFLYRDRLEAVGVADVQAVADRFLRADNRTAGLFLPTEQPQGVTVPARPDLAELLKDYEGREVAAGGEAFDPDPRAIENRVTRTVLPSGLKVVLLPKATRGDTVAARLTFRYGNERTLQGRAMAAQLLPSLLLRGTETLTRQQIQDRLDELQASVRAGGGPGSVTFTITAKKDTLLPVLDLIGDVLAHATLPPDELELLRQATLARVEQNRSEPQALAPTAVQRALSAYPDPADPRYVPTPTEQAEMVRGVEPADVTAIYEELLTDAVGELAVVGSFDPDAVLAAAEENLAGWAGGDAPPFARLPREVRPDAPSGDTTIPTPDKKSAVYFAGLTAPISDAHPDYPALLIGNYVLGSSGLSSRLGDRVRQRDGLSYGISSGLQARARDDYTLFYLFAIANPENVPALKAAIREEVERLIAEGATPEEVEAAKTSYLQKQRVTRAADASLASSLATQAYHDRTMAFAAEREDAVAALTAEQVNAALRTWLDPEALFIAVAGDLDVPPADDAAPGVGPWRSEAAVPSCGAAIPSRGAATVRERPCRRGPRERRSLTVAAPTRPRLQPRPSLTRRVGRVSAVRFPRRVPPMSAPLALAAALPVLFGAPAPAEPPPASPPNVLLIVVDDLGAYDLGCCSEEDAPLHETPRIDALAAAGTRFRQAYAAASVCSPTRAALLTGRHPVRCEITDWIPGVNAERRKHARFRHVEDRHDLAPSETTLAEVLKSSGYRTFFAGKWHLGGGRGAVAGTLPTDQGYEVNVGGFHAGSPPGGYYAPWTNPYLEADFEGEYLTDRLAAESAAFVADASRRDDGGGRPPFFLTLCFYNVHTPIQPDRETVARFEAKAERLFPGDTPTVPCRGAVSRARRDDPEYASMVAAVDRAVGTVLDALGEAGVREETLILLTSDNGGLCTLPNRPGPTCNAPLKSGKGWLYEGGIRVPLILAGPGVPAGAVTDEPAVSQDLFPTVLELCGLAAPEPGEIDGASLAPALRGGALADRDLWWHYPHYHGSGWSPGAALRRGGLKLIEFYETGEAELYDLDADPGESRDLAEQRPADLHALRTALSLRQARSGATRPVSKAAADRGADANAANADGGGS